MSEEGGTDMKTGTKMILITAAVLILVWGILFAVDYHAVMDLKEPVIARHIGVEGGTYQGIGWTVEIEKIHRSTENGEDLGWFTESAEIRLFGILIGAVIT